MEHKITFTVSPTDQRSGLAHESLLFFEKPLLDLKTMKQYLIIALILLAQTAFAAPIPGAGSKAKPQLGVYKSPQGFEIQTAGSSWIQSSPPKQTRYIATMFRSPTMKNDVRATLTVRVDKMKTAMDINDYVKIWTKEYPKFGFDVKGSKKFTMNGNKGYVIDLLNPVKKRQLRQVIFMKDKKAVLMTCRDHQETFKSSLAECNKMIKSFKWEQVADATPGNKKKI